MNTPSATTSDRGVDSGIVLSGRAAGIVVKHVEPAKLIDCLTDRRLQAIPVGYVGEDRDGLVAGELRGFLARRAIESHRESRRAQTIGIQVGA
jgi:hypothetical protein